MSLESNPTRITTTSVEQTRRLGAFVAKTTLPGDVYGLIGGLGVGKTEFVRGFVAACGGDISVRSPTFSLVNIYETSSFDLYHLDFYRLKSAQELFEIGFYECLDSGGVVIVEWADLFPEALPINTKILNFSDAGESGRLVETNFEVAGFSQAI